MVESALSTPLTKALNDDTLDFNCKGIMAHLSLCKNEMSYIEELMQTSGSSSAVIKRSLTRLENKGYVGRYHVSDFDRLPKDKRIVWYRIARDNNE